MNIKTLISFCQKNLKSDIIKNAFWLIGDKIFRMGGGLLVGVLVAKYLGPEQFGLFNFSFSFVWLFSYTVTLGLDDIVIKELIKSPENRDKLLGTAFWVKLFGGIFTFIIIGISIYFIKSGYNKIVLLTLVMALSMVIKNVGVFRLLYESQLQSKVNVWAENVGFIAVSLLRLYLIYILAPLIYFAWALVFEFVISSIAFLYLYNRRSYKIAAWSFDKILAKRLLTESWPLILSGISIMIYVKSDQVMLGLMAGNYETGIYSVAARISEIWYFIPVALVTSYFPSIVESKKVDEKVYQMKFQKLFNLMVYISLTIAILMTFLSKYIVFYLFGKDYAESSIVLSTHIWAGIFVFLGVASTKYFIVENLQKYYFYQTIIGAGCNICLNILFIPLLGAQGAALATVLSYGVSVFSSILFPKSKELGIMLFRALCLVDNLKYVFKKSY